MKITCPQCNGEKFLNDLDRVQTDLDYPNRKLRQTPDYPYGGFPPLACNMCKGQGYVDSDAYIGKAFMLHLDASGFWVLADLPIPREAMFRTDIASGFNVIDTTALTSNTYGALMSNGFVVLN